MLRRYSPPKPSKPLTKMSKEEKIDFIIAKLGGLETGLMENERLLIAHEEKLKDLTPQDTDSEELNTMRSNMTCSF